MTCIGDCTSFGDCLLVPRGTRLDLCGNEIAALPVERGEFS